ncbi:MAG: hypothetical protein HY851_04685 [candidate division Zixibacteria bacterium]|nr:hypothetical protein [candidate division Zixibacteria bacterium]
MKSILFAGAVLLSATLVGAADSSMVASENAFDAFHVVMHPIWHEAYPAKDYAALIASGPHFAEKYEPVAKLDPPIKNPIRLAAFKSHRQQMGILVTQFADACRKNDSAKVYEITPAMHQAFEDAMFDLGPMNCGLIDGLLITADLIADMHIPAENWDGIQGSSETLIMKLDHAKPEMYPAELQPFKDNVAKEFAQLRGLADQLKACADKKDMACAGARAAELKKQITAIRENYL